MVMKVYMLVSLTYWGVFRSLYGAIVVDTQNDWSSFEVAWKPANKRECHIDSLTAMHIAMYSSSQDELATQVWFLDLQDTAAPATKNRKPLVNFRLLLHPAQSASEKPSDAKGLFPSNAMP